MPEWKTKVAAKSDRMTQECQGPYSKCRELACEIKKSQGKTKRLHFTTRNVVRALINNVTSAKQTTFHFAATAATRGRTNKI